MVNEYVRQNIYFLLFRIATFLSVVFLLFILLYILKEGIGVIDIKFLTSMWSHRDITQGGIFPAIIGTIFLAIGVSIISIPIGICTAIYLNEYAKENLQSLFENENLTLNLDKYCFDPDNDTLTYSYYKPDNISISLDNNIVTLIPQINFTGTRYIFFIVNDSKLIAISNVFAVSVLEKSEELKQHTAIIGQPVKWTKRVMVTSISTRVNAFSLVLFCFLIILSLAHFW